MSIDFKPTQQFLTNGITQNNSKGQPYLKYVPVSEIGEIRDILVDSKNGGTVRQVLDKEGNEIFTVGSEARIYDVNPIFKLDEYGQPMNQKLNVQA